ncbi:MAG: sulfur reduction protein DsrE [Planctomycetes bacterium RBG_16_55_9]|nr:MAG: sulfur reduction protein DsrE [Planctomycetes bacterium RBG_16_55_9]
MKIGIVICSNDPETVWNALRYANFCLAQANGVKIFFMGKGVEYQKISTQKFNTVEQAEKFTRSGGEVYACGTCIKSREQQESNLCPISTMKDMYDIVQESDRVLTF